MTVKIRSITTKYHPPLQEPIVIEQEREEIEKEPVVQVQEEAPSHVEEKDPEPAQQELEKEKILDI